MSQGLRFSNRLREVQEGGDDRRRSPEAPLLTTPRSQGVLVNSIKELDSQRLLKKVAEKKRKRPELSHAGSPLRFSGPPAVSPVKRYLSKRRMTSVAVNNTSVSDEEEDLDLVVAVTEEDDQCGDGEFLRSVRRRLAYDPPPHRLSPPKTLNSDMFRDITSNSHRKVMLQEAIVHIEGGLDYLKALYGSMDDDADEEEGSISV